MKDKASELVKSFVPCVVLPEHEGYSAVFWDKAKECALICVDEIINAMPTEPSSEISESFPEDINEAIRYWEGVKQEIQKL